MKLHSGDVILKYLCPVSIHTNKYIYVVLLSITRRIDVKGKLYLGISKKKLIE